MSANKQQYLGENYLVEIGDGVVEIWRILLKEQTGKNAWRSTLTHQENRSLPLSAEEAQHLVSEFLADIDPDQRQPIIEALK